MKYLKGDGLPDGAPGPFIATLQTRQVCDTRLNVPIPGHDYEISFLNKSLGSVLLISQGLCIYWGRAGSTQILL